MAKAISTSTSRQIVSNIAQSKWVRRIIFYALLLVLWQAFYMAYSYKLRWRACSGLPLGMAFHW